MSLLFVFLLKHSLALYGFLFFLLMICHFSKKFQLEESTYTESVEQECDKRKSGLYCWNAKNFSFYNKHHLLKYVYLFLISNLLHWSLTHSNLLPVSDSSFHHLPFVIFILSHPCFYVHYHKFLLNLIQSSLPLSRVSVPLSLEPSGGSPS